ncbi:MAG: hypothetical protein ACRC62_03200 [Microcoleus sp.]
MSFNFSGFYFLSANLIGVDRLFLSNLGICIDRSGTAAANTDGGRLATIGQ